MKSPGTHPALRSVALIVIAMALLFLNREQTGEPWHSALILATIIAGYILTGSMLAVALASAAMAGLYIDIQSPEFAPKYLYPGITVGALSVCLLVIVRRWRAHIRATHQARWQRRHKGGAKKSKTT